SLSRFPLLDSHTSWNSPLSLHDALPISPADSRFAEVPDVRAVRGLKPLRHEPVQRLSDHFGGLVPEHDFGRGIEQRDVLLVVDRDRKSTRLNSSHVKISYAVFFLKKKKQ